MLGLFVARHPKSPASSVAFVTDDDDDDDDDDSVRPFFALVPWMDYFSPFPNGGVEPESTTNVAPTRTGKNPESQIEM